MIRLWPKSLAARLAVLIVATLAAAQLVLIFVVRDEQDAVVKAMLHGQALTQTITLARLLAASPSGERAALVASFHSPQTCARLLERPPIASAEMTKAERQLADILAGEFIAVGDNVPVVAVEGIAEHTTFCAAAATEAPSGGSEMQGHGMGWGRGLGMGMGAGMGLGRMAHEMGSPSWLALRAPDSSVEMAVPIQSGQWLAVSNAVSTPNDWGQLTLLSFLLSSAAVALVVAATVRFQTRSLRVLAQAADRLGRGEAVAPLAVTGPAEVAAASRAFNLMQERLGRFVADRLRLLGAISHDLRTPLTTLRLKAEFIEDEDTRATIVATIDEMAAMAEATLNLTRAEAIEETTEQVDLAAIVSSVADDFVLADADVVVADSASVPYACRPVAMKRAISNLVDNAVRYGSRAVLRLSAPDGEPTITVDDDGPGLPVDQVEEAFQPFVRLESSRSRDTGGMGLGLATTRGIVQSHGGTVTLANRPGGGLRAEIRLPAPQVHA
ncbi:ATP-binding protein [Consotaella aegiceratis]|uniref:ATP-binding protein n=1 Tax=Consotaella aegiceratis TaxID=3097961 RepID=UPI002F40E056